MGARGRPQSRIAEGQGGIGKMNESQPLDYNLLDKALWSFYTFFEVQLSVTILMDSVAFLRCIWEI